PSDFSKGLLLLFHIDNPVYHIFGIASPWDGPVILLIMKVEMFSAVFLQLFENLGVIYRKFKLITGERTCPAFTKTFLNNLTFIGFENIALLHRVIQIAGFHPFTKYKIVFIPDEYSAKKENNKQHPYKDLSVTSFFLFKLIFGHSCFFMWFSGLTFKSLTS